MSTENKREKRHLSAVQSIVFGFLAMIILGAILLWLPISSSDGSFTKPEDAFFSAVTSVCVTGLSTVNMAAHWSLTGKIIILVLIQLGGLGVVSAVTGLFLLMRKRITMRERILIQTAYNLDTMDGLVRTIRSILAGTFGMELVGAALYSTVFVPEYGPAKGLWYSVFHAVSAFCNAGIDILGDESLAAYVTNPMINFTTILLITMGGLGFLVWWDIKLTVKTGAKTGRLRGVIFKKLSVHSKLAIVCTLILLVFGTFVIFAFEYTNEKTIGNMGLGGKIMSSMFQNVTTRTAGFYTIPQENFRNSTYVVLIMLMFTGGSPMGTAGGIKTTTVAMILCSVSAVIKGRKDTEIFHRRIGAESIRSALAIVTIALGIAFGAVITLTCTEDFGLRDICYEVFSAIGTAGLSRGITGDLTTSGKLVICMVMFAGRIGPVTLAMAFKLKRRKSTQVNLRELAEGRIMIG